MNKEELERFINSIGATVEIWVFAYNQFISNGFDENKALEHTKAYMSMALGLGTKNTDKEETNDD